MPATAIMPRSHCTHSARLLASRATRSPTCNPKVSKPLAMLRTLSLIACQEIVCQVPPRFTNWAGRCARLAAWAKNIWGMLCASIPAPPSIRRGWTFEPHGHRAIIHEAHGHMRAKGAMRHWHTVPFHCRQERFVALVRQVRARCLRKGRTAPFAAISVQRKLRHHEHSALDVLHVQVHLALRVLKNA